MFIRSGFVVQAVRPLRNKYIDLAVTTKKFFPSGFVSLVQINKLGAYNEIGETITLKATIKNPETPTGFKLFKGETEDTISNSPSPSKNEDGDVSIHNTT